MEHSITPTEVVLLTAYLGSPVLALTGGIVACLSRHQQKFRIALNAGAAIALSLAGAILLWLGLGASDLDIPERIFMIGGVIHLPTLLSSLLVCCAAVFTLRRPPRRVVV